MLSDNNQLPLMEDDVYKKWLVSLKQQFKQAQIKAVVQVNQELLQFYWKLGEQIVER